MKTKIVLCLLGLIVLSGCAEVSKRFYDVDTVGSLIIEVESAYNQYQSGGGTELSASLPADVPIPFDFRSDMNLTNVRVRIRNVSDVVQIKLKNVGNQGGEK